MKPIGSYDQAYLERVRSAVSTAIIAQSLDTATGVVMLRTVEIVDALVTMVALIACGLNDVDTDEGREAVGAYIGSRIPALMAQAQANVAGLPFDVVRAGDLNDAPESPGPRRPPVCRARVLPRRTAVCAGREGPGRGTMQKF